MFTLRTKNRCPDCGSLVNKDGRRRRDVTSDCRTCSRGESPTVQSIAKKGNTLGWESRTR